MGTNVLKRFFNAFRPDNGELTMFIIILECSICENPEDLREHFEVEHPVTLFPHTDPCQPCFHHRAQTRLIWSMQRVMALNVYSKTYCRNFPCQCC